MRTFDKNEINNFIFSYLFFMSKKKLELVEILILRHGSLKYETFMVCACNWLCEFITTKLNHCWPVNYLLFLLGDFFDGTFLILFISSPLKKKFKRQNNFSIKERILVFIIFSNVITILKKFSESAFNRVNLSLP